MRISFIGFMGSGKSTCAKALASDMGYQYIDLDHCIEENEGRTVASIFYEFGEPYFREAEHKALKEILANKHHDIVIACGGGVILNELNRQMLREHTTCFFLNVQPAVLTERLFFQKENRPLIRDKNRAEMISFIEQELSRRMTFYKETGVELLLDGHEDVHTILNKVHQHLH